MRGIAISKGIDCIFQKKQLISFYFLSILFFFKKKKQKKTPFTMGGRPITYIFQKKYIYIYIYILNKK
jgi:hypothetical protein